MNKYNDYSVGELRQLKAAKSEESARQLPSSGPMTPEQRTKFDDIHGQIEEINAEMRRKDQLRLEEELAYTIRPPQDLINADVRQSRNSTRPYIATPEERAYEKSFFELGGYARSGNMQGMIRESRDTLSGVQTVAGVTSSLATSVLVPQGFVQELEIAMKWYGDMLNVGRIIETATGAPLPHPTMNDTSISAEQVGEGVQVSDQTLSVSNVIFNAYKYSTKMIPVSLELLQDSAFDLAGYIKDAAAIRLARKLNYLFTVGDGNAKPTGFLQAAADSGITAVGDDNSASPDPTTEIGFTDLVSLEHSVDRMYRKGAIYMCHDQTLKYLQSLKDKYGRPLFQQPTAGEPLVINGYEVHVNNDMDSLINSPAAPRKTLAFGAFKKYTIRKVREMTMLRLVERYADYGVVAFLGFARYDGNLLDAGTKPIKYLVSPAS